MSEQTFDDRLAALEEHIVEPEPPTAEECLQKAEQCLADGHEQAARSWLRNAKLAREFAEIDELLDELEEDDDDR